MLTTINPSVLKDAGCQLATRPQLFVGLCQVTNNDPCKTGCVFFEGGRCPAYRKYHSNFNKVAPGPVDPLIGGAWAGMTMKQIAAKEGISLNEARRRKQDGRYK